MAAERQVGKDPLAEMVDAWWLGVLEGQSGRDHPIYGNGIHAHLRNDVLDVSGFVESAKAYEELQLELSSLEGDGVRTARVNVRIQGPPGEKGVLRQRILAFFANEEQAKMAERLLEGHPDVSPLRSQIIGESLGAEALADLSDDWMREISRGFKKAGSLLLTEVDEVEAFRANELLAETRTRQVFVLPPEVY